MGTLSAQQVDPFSGDLHYSIPLLEIPSPEGNPVPVGANYSSGITVERSASDIGLGWNLAAGGEVFRSVNNFPDDWKGIRTANEQEKAFKDHYGTLYFNAKAYPGFESEDLMDTYTSSWRMDTLEFVHPAYDAYYVVSPGMNGRISPYLFDFGTLQAKKDNGGSVFPGLGFTKKPQFRFVGEHSSFIENNRYPERIDPSTPLVLPPHLSGDNSEVFEGPGYLPAKNRMSGARFVEYFTNAEISDHRNGVMPIAGGFVEFDPDFGRSSSHDVDPDGIGAFRVTDVNGTVYHYSLPVYVHKKVSRFYPLDHDYSINNDPASAQAFGEAGHPDTIIKAGDQLLYFTQKIKYAVSWKLTAITGVNYVDENGNGLVDEADSGYWVKYDYQQWTDQFVFRTPHYGFDYAFTGTQDDPTADLGISDPAKKSGKEGQYHLVEQDIYYLNSIKTATHTALFVRSIRNDGHSFRPKGSATIPQLRLDRIMLLRNDALNGLAALSPITTTNTDWDLTGTTASLATIYNKQWYDHNKTTIDPVCLKSIEFVQDYSLARKFYNNVHTHINNAKDKTTPADVLTSVSSPNVLASGKLTLLKIRSLEFGNEQISPSWQFDYRQINALKNPVYHPLKADYWGNFKIDISDAGFSGYPTGISSEHSDAWSLYQVTTPAGAKLTIEYEPDRYNQVLREQVSHSGAIRTYPITHAIPISGQQGSGWEVTMEDNTEDLYELLTNAPTGTEVHAVIPFKRGADLFQSAGSFTFTTDPDQHLKTLEDLPIYDRQAGQYFTTNNMTGTLEYTGGGYISFVLPGDLEVPGGGVRVSSLTTISENCDPIVQRYTYEDGITPTEPDRFAPPETISDPFGNDLFRPVRAFEGDNHRLGAQVGYGKVTVEQVGAAGNTTGKVVHEFINSDENIPNYQAIIVNRETPVGLESDCTDGKRTERIIKVDDQFMAQLGKQLSQTVYDVNDNIISLVKNEYEPTMQGAVEELFHVDRSFSVVASSGPKQKTCYFNNAVYIKRTWPCVLKRTIRHSGSQASVSENLAFDPLSGVPVQTKLSDPSQGTTIVEQTPTFRIYAAMGSKNQSIFNKNLLSGLTQTKSIKDKQLTGSDDFTGLEISVWSGNALVRSIDPITATYQSVAVNDNFWAPKKTYQWTGPLTQFGLFDHSKLIAFDYQTLTNNGEEYRLEQEITLFDPRHHPLEIRSFNNRYSATKFGYDQEYPIAVAGNCNFESFTYSGFEDKTLIGSGLSPVEHFGGEVTGGQHQSSGTATVQPHTGEFLVELAQGTAGPSFRADFQGTGPNGEDLGLQRGRSYRASVWVHRNSGDGAGIVAELNGVDGSGQPVRETRSVNKLDPGAIIAGNWMLISLVIDVPDDFKSTGHATGDLQIYLENPSGSNGTAWYDDWIIRPIDATLEANVYERSTGRIVAKLDQNGFGQRFVYDAAGRLLETWTEIEGHGFVKQQEQAYEFARDLD